jgi:transcriptional regulator with XRE-family HTH domain
VLGERLRLIRNERGLSQRDVESATGIHYSSVAHYELGLKNPSRKKLEALAKYYGVSVSWLLGHTDQRTVPEINVAPDQIREEVAQYTPTTVTDPRVLEIARELQTMDLTREEARDILKYARFIAQREKEHSAKNTKIRQK